MSGTALVILRAWEIADDLLAAATGVSVRLAERAVLRVLRARALRWGDSVEHPPVAVLHLSPADYQRHGPALEAELAAMERRVAERLDPDNPSSVRILIRPRPGTRRLRVAAPLVRNVVPVHRQPGATPERTRPYPAEATRPYPTEQPLALLGGSGGLPIVVPADGLVLGRGERGPGHVLDPRVSRHHVRLRRSGPDRLTCQDLGSHNGTWVDGVRISRATELRAGQRLRIGDLEFRIVREGSNGGIA